MKKKSSPLSPDKPASSTSLQRRKAMLPLKKASSRKKENGRRIEKSILIRKGSQSQELVVSNRQPETPELRTTNSKFGPHASE